MTSPTQLSLKRLRESGWDAFVVEYWDHRAKQRRDFLGFADIFATKPGGKPLLVQTTTSSNMAARRKKILASATALGCLLSGCRIQVHGWAKNLVKRGGKQRKWVCNEREMVPGDWIIGGGNG